MTEAGLKAAETFTSLSHNWKESCFHLHHQPPRWTIKYTLSKMDRKSIAYAVYMSKCIVTEIVKTQGIQGPLLVFLSTRDTHVVQT